MKYYFKRYWGYILSLFLLVGILSWLYNQDRITSELFLALIATCISIFVSIINYYHNTDKLFKELFTEFNQRFDKMNNYLNSINDDTILEVNEKQKVIDYLNLCAEEYMWVEKGRIPENIWNNWKNGIHYYLNKKPIRDVYENEKRLWKDSYYGLFEALKI